MAATARGRYRDVLRRRDFAILVASALVDGVGTWTYSVVIGVVIYERTHSPLLLAAITASRWLPALLIGSFAGLVADRYERTRVMVCSALASAVVMGGIATSVGLQAPVWTLVVLSAVSAVVSSPYAPAAGGLTPELLDEGELTAGNALLASLDGLVAVLGPALGGLLLAVGTPVGGIVTNAASFLLAAALVVALRVRSRGDAGSGAHPLAALVEGLRALAGERLALTLVAFCALDTAIYGATTVLYVPLSVRLGTGAEGYGYLFAGTALGSLLAAALANRLAASVRLAPVIVASLVAQSGPIALSALTHSPPVAFVLQVVSGAGMVVVDVLAMTALQRDLRGGLLSRVLGVCGSLYLAGALIASFAAAGLLRLAGTAGALVIVGAGCAALAVAALPLLRRVDAASLAGARSREQRVDALTGLDLFADAPRPVLERLARDAEERSLPAGTLLIRQGEPADALWVLLEGALSVRAERADGSVRGLPPVTTPGYVGELGLLHGVARTATVQVTSDARALRIAGPDFLAALESSPPSGSFVALTGLRWTRTELPRRVGEHGTPGALVR